jgi:hypothetical protein
MNERRFDTIARGLAGPLPRRPLIGVLAGALTAAWVLPEQALACKKVGRKCDKNKDCCDGARCKGGKNGKCRCKGGFTKCGKQCYNLDKDEQHCGACDNACAEGDSCIDGSCAEFGCTANLDSCEEDALCIACPNRPEAVCYLDDEGRARCSLVLLCTGCEEDADCDGFGPGARCVLNCPGQCSTGACAGG